MSDPYREPVDDTSVPPTVATPVARVASPVPPAPAEASAPVPPAVPNGFIPDAAGNIPMPDAPIEEPAPTSVVPPTSIPAEAPVVIEPSLGIPNDGPGVPSLAPATPAPEPVPSAPAVPVAPEPAASIAAIHVMPTPANETDKVTTPLADVPAHDAPSQPAPIAPEPFPTPAPHLAGEIPLQKIPELPMTPLASVAVAPTPDPTPAASRESAIRTLETDIASHVQRNQLSIAQIAMAQKEKDRSVISEPSDDGGGRSFLFGVMSTILVLGGLAALGAIVYSLRDSFDVPFFDEGSRVETIIPAESITTYDVSTTTRVAVFSRIDAFIQDPSAQALDVRALVFTERITGTTTRTETLSLEAFMDLIDSRAPGRLVRTLGPEMMFGAIGNEPFLLARHSSYENAFAGMLEWEPLMRDDLPFLLYAPPERPTFPSATTTESSAADPEAPAASGGFAPLDDSVRPGLVPVDPIPPATSTASQATTSLDAPAPEPIILSAVWKDIVVRNVDTRALIREDGELLMLYTFLRGDLMLITTRKETMAVILDILATPSFGE